MEKNIKENIGKLSLSFRLCVSLIRFMKNGWNKKIKKSRGKKYKIKGEIQGSLIWLKMV